MKITEKMTISTTINLGNKKGHQKGKVIKRKKLKKDGKYDDDHKERKRRS